VRAQRPPEADWWKYTIRQQVVCMDPRPSPPRELTYVFFRTAGCRYDRAGECTMCNYGISHPVGVPQMVDNVREALNRAAAYDALGVTPLGNMFDTLEVPKAAREAIVSMAAERAGSIYSCESRPETLSEADIAETVARLGRVRFFVNLGLEAAHPWVQANCVGKSLDASAFRRAVTALRRHGAHPVANVLLGVPFLTAAEAIDSAVGSIRWALANGSHLCVLFPSNIKSWTLQEWLWERGMYRAPSLWSLVETLIRLGPADTRSVVLSWYGTSPTDASRHGRASDPLLVSPDTCERCRPLVLEVLDAFNAGASYETIVTLSELDCSCHDAWRDLLAWESAESLPLAHRTLAAYNRIGEELLGRPRWDALRDRARASFEAGYDGSVKAT
jgi:archaeosine synthase beta-subunit